MPSIAKGAVGAGDLVQLERLPPTTSQRGQDAGQAAPSPNHPPPDQPTAELQIRAALLNRFTALGTPKTVRVA